MADKGDIQYRELERRKPIKYFRKLDKDCPRLAYNHYEDIKFSGHWGQRKLLYTEIEFFSIASRFLDINKKNCLIVYIGAANGVRDNIYKKLFPDTQFLLYDPQPFAIKESEQFIIKTDKDGFFSDEKIKEVFDIAKGRKIIYICDIRSDTSEYAIWDNMQQQQRWGIKLGAEMMMLKMRFPYTSIIEHGVKEDIHVKPYELGEIKDQVIILNEKQNNELLYLMGNIYFQIHAPKRSTETRLITGKIKYMNKDEKYEKDGEKYALKYYDADKYEEQLNYFNVVYRTQRYKYKESEDMVNHIIGFDMGYDMTGEYAICDKYFRYYKKEEYSHENIVKLLNEINIFMNVITNVTCLVTFPLVSYSDNYLSMLEDKKCGSKCTEYYKRVVKLIYKNVDNYKAQKALVLKSNILSEKEIKDQMKIYENKSIRLKGVRYIIKFNEGDISAFKYS